MKKGLLFGCFDPLHAGHVRLFRNCKNYCDYLIVCVHDDDYIKKHKGREPFYAIDERVRDVYDIRSVDEARVNPDRDRNSWVRELSVDIVFEGEGKFNYICETKTMPRTPKISSEKLR